MNGKLIDLLRPIFRASLQEYTAFLARTLPSKPSTSSFDEYLSGCLSEYLAGWDFKAWLQAFLTSFGGWFTNFLIGLLLALASRKSK